MEKLSVIVPIYNSEKYLLRCLDSIANQKYTAIQAILVDDGSTDKSGEICQNYCAKDSRFEYHYQPNGGRSKARNEGLKFATGQWITFCDSDDWVNEDYYLNFMKCAQTPGVGLVIAGYVLTNGVQSWYEALPIHKETISSRELALRFWDYHELDLLSGNCNKLYFRELIQEHFHEKMVCGEDMHFNMDYLSHVSVVAFSDDSGYNYYQENDRNAKYKTNGAWQCLEYTMSIRHFLELNLQESEYSDSFQMFLFQTICRDVAMICKIHSYDEAKRMVSEFYEYEPLKNSIYSDTWKRCSAKYKLIGFLLRKKMYTALISSIKST